MTDCDDLNAEHIDDQNTINCLMGERESQQQRDREGGKRGDATTLYSLLYYDHYYRQGMEFHYYRFLHLTCHLPSDN